MKAVTVPVKCGYAMSRAAVAMLGDLNLDLGSRGIGVRDDAHALLAADPAAREQSEFGGEQRRLAVAGRGLDVAGPRVGEEVDLARVGEIAATKFVAKRRKQFGSERQDVEHRAIPSASCHASGAAAAVAAVGSSSSASGSSATGGLPGT